jgi:deferrochelatase/peroxidase EfeB
MSLNLQQTALGLFDRQNEFDPEGKTPGRVVEAALADTQGNILKSNGRDHHIHLFVKFTAAPADIRAWLQMMGTRHVTSALQQYQEPSPRRTPHADGGVFTNLCLSAVGYKKLGPTVVMPDDTSFLAGAKERVKDLYDPAVTEWECGFQEEIHALVIVAADKQAEADSTAHSIIDSLDKVGEIVNKETGAAIRLDRSGQPTEDPTGQVYEHFGFADNVSQPLFFADDLQAARRRSGFDRYDPSAPLDLVLLKDPGGGPNGYGSYFVYRKLQQHVAKFREDEAQLAQKLAHEIHGPGAVPTDEEKNLAAAYIVGRFRDGTPVVEQAVDGWLSKPNNFNFDADGVRCPFHAHIRKVNPRGDKVRQFVYPPGEDRARRIARRGVSFWEPTLEPTEKPVGLLFICAQSSIVDQFEFQIIWSNLTDFLRPDTGLDPITGAAKPGEPAVPQQWLRAYGSHNEIDFSKTPPQQHSPYIPCHFGSWVTMRGGEYFFVPSLSFLTGTGA